MTETLHIGIGDLHGHLKALLSLLSALEKEIGIFQKDSKSLLKENIFLTFTGDYVDLGAHSKDILEAVKELQLANPNNVACLFGNHELLALADLPNAQMFVDSNEENPLELYAWGLHGANGGIPFIENFGDTPKEAMCNYAAAMHRDAPLGGWLRTLLPFSIQTSHGKKILFVHGGVPESLQNPQKLGEYAEIFRAHMECRTGILQKGSQKYGVKNPIVGKESVFWDRSFPNLPDKEAKEITERLGVDYIVIGHTPQRDGVPANYGNKIFNMDVGMCPAYGENTPTAIIFDENGPHMFQPQKGKKTLIKKEEDLKIS